MLNLFSQAEPETPPQVTLRRIWRVEADRSYDNYPGNDSTLPWRVIRTLGGRGEIFLRDGTRWQMEAATVACLRIEEIRRYRCVAEHWDFWWFECDIQSVAGTKTRRPPFPAALTVEESSIREQAWRSLQHPAAERRRAASASLGYLLQLWRAMPEGGRKMEDRVGDVLADIPLRLANPWSVPDMAKAAGMSERAFRDAFKTVTGESPGRYVRTLRLKTAAELLTATGLQVQEIAAQLGFSNAFHLSKSFRDAYQLPPTAYRRRYRNRL